MRGVCMYVDDYMGIEWLICASIGSKASGAYVFRLQKCFWWLLLQDEIYSLTTKPVVKKIFSFVWKEINFFPAASLSSEIKRRRNEKTKDHLSF